MDRIKIGKTLLSMGIPASIKGHRYIIEAMEIYDEQGLDLSFTKELYPDIAKKCKTTASKVERAIRYAFVMARDTGDFEEVEKYIGFVNTTNSASLANLYTILKQEDEDMRTEDKKKSLWDKAAEPAATRKPASEISKSSSNGNAVSVSEEVIRIIVREELQNACLKMAEIFSTCCNAGSDA